MEILNKEAEMKVGIFWFVENTLVYKAENILSLNKDSLGLVDSDFTHAEEWELNLLHAQFHLNILSSAYHHFPRGRVIFDSSSQFSTVYLDKKIFNRLVKNAIITAFELDCTTTKWFSDPHYRCFSEI
jgi:hypothetical protein